MVKIIPYAMGLNLHCRGCEIVTNVGTYMILGVFIKVGINKVQIEYLVNSGKLPNVYIKCKAECIDSEYLNSDITDMAFMKGIKDYSNIIMQYEKNYNRSMKGGNA